MLPLNDIKAFWMFITFTGGLLHSVPEHEDVKDVSGKINVALRECVAEKRPHRRVKAVKDLADLVALFQSRHVENL